MCGEGSPWYICSFCFCVLRVCVCVYTIPLVNNIAFLLFCTSNKTLWMLTKRKQYPPPRASFHIQCFWVILSEFWSSWLPSLCTVSKVDGKFKEIEKSGTLGLEGAFKAQSIFRNSVSVSQIDGASDRKITLVQYHSAPALCRRLHCPLILTALESANVRASRWLSARWNQGIL